MDFCPDEDFPSSLLDLHCAYSPPGRYMHALYRSKSPRRKCFDHSWFKNKEVVKDLSGSKREALYSDHIGLREI
jgi:hypothetical protein